jgi:hypothetical protein
MEEKLVHRGWFSIVIGVLCVMSYFGSRMILRIEDLERSTRILVALIPAIPFALFLWLFVRNIGKLDEMERKIQMEALAFAFPLSVFMLMFLGLLQLAVPLSQDDWSYRHVWIYLPIFYLAGLVIAWRRYK